MRQDVSCGTLGCYAKPAGQRQRLQIQAGYDFFADHPASLHLGSRSTGSDLQSSKSDDRRCFEAQ